MKTFPNLLCPLALTFLFSAQLNAQLIQLEADSLTDFYDQGEFSTIASAPAPGALDLTGIQAGDFFVLEFNAPEGMLFSFNPEVWSPEPGDPDAVLMANFFWVEGGKDIGSTSNLLSSPSFTFTNASLDFLPEISSTGIARNLNGGAFIQISAFANLGHTPFTFEGLRFTAQWLAAPNGITVDWSSGSSIQVWDENFLPDPTTPLLTLVAVPEPTLVGVFVLLFLLIVVSFRQKQVAFARN